MNKLTITRSSISNLGFHSHDRRFGAILIHDSSGINVGDKFIIDGIKRLSLNFGYHSDGERTYIVAGDFTLTLVQKKEGICIFTPSLVSEGEHRNSTSMLVEGMELKQLKERSDESRN